MVWRADDPEGLESDKIKWELVPYTRGQGLDVGCGSRKPFKHFIGIDNYKDTAIFGNSCNPDVWAYAEDLGIFADDAFDFVYSSHTLEHIDDHEKALKEWWRVLKQDGYLVLYLPHADHYPHIGTKGANPDHKHDFLPSDIVDVMHKIGGWDLIRNEVRTEGREYSFFQVYRKLRGNRHHESWKKPRHEKSVALVRYGAIGDLLQASSVAKGLKDQGWHVTFYTSPPQSDVLKHDPNIDEIVLQDKDQVPNHELGPFWDSIKKKHDKFINLSESVEGAFLALPGRTPHMWSPRARHAYLNRNYLESQHLMADVPHVAQMRFYATAEEKAWAREERKKFGEFSILWSLSGSSVNKTWPYVDNVIAALMLHSPGTHVTFVGDAVCTILERGWENEPRVHCRSGKYSIRQSLSLLDVVDCVIGPETGVLNGAACLPVPKVVFLSHSSVENLTRDWVNTYSLTSENVTCKGRGNNEAPTCHQLHYGWDHCTKDFDEECPECIAKTCTKHTCAAVCQSTITPDRVTQILLPLIEKREAA